MAAMKLLLAIAVALALSAAQVAADTVPAADTPCKLCTAEERTAALAEAFSAAAIQAAKDYELHVKPTPASRANARRAKLAAAAGAKAEGNGTQTEGVQAAQTTFSVGPWGQCGGRAYCGAPGRECADLPWSAARCSTGHACMRDNEWWWACKPVGRCTMDSQCPFNQYCMQGSCVCARGRGGPNCDICPVFSWSSGGYPTEPRLPCRACPPFTASRFPGATHPNDCVPMFG